MSWPFFSNYADQFLKLIDVDGSCDSPACRKQLVVYRPFRVAPNEEEMFALVGFDFDCVGGSASRGSQMACRASVW